MVLRDVQSLKVPLKHFTFRGIVALVKDVQPSKVYIIFSTVSGIMGYVLREVQLLYVLVIVFTVLGMVGDLIISLQPVNVSLISTIGLPLISVRIGL